MIEKDVVRSSSPECQGNRFPSPCGEMIEKEWRKNNDSMAYSWTVSIPLRGNDWKSLEIVVTVPWHMRVSIPLRGNDWKSIAALHGLTGSFPTIVSIPLRGNDWKSWEVSSRKAADFVFPSPCGEMIEKVLKIDRLSPARAGVSIPLRGNDWKRGWSAWRGGCAPLVSIPLRGNDWKSKEC